MLFTNAIVLLASASLAFAFPGKNPGYETTCSAVYKTKSEVGSYTKTWATTEYKAKPTTYLKTLTYTDVVQKPITTIGKVTKARTR
jgi:hypothetical protein